MRESISVAMCTYNGEKYLRQQLDSIAKQTRRPDEMVICDDRSSDGTINIITDFAQNAGFPVNWSINDKNLGSTKNFEKAIGLCSGSIIVLSDQDDLWMPDKLELIEKEFLAGPETGAVFTDAGTMDENADPLGYSLWESIRFNKKEQAKVADGRAPDVLLKHDVVTGATMAFRASCRQIALPIPEPWVHDAWLALVIATVSELKLIDRPLIKYRIHHEQQLGRPKEPFMAKVAREIKNIKENRAKAFDKAKSDRAAELEMYTEAYGRLAEYKNEHGPTLSSIREKACHARSRINIMGTNRLFRVWLISKELVSMRYHRYSYGCYSAFKDLVV